MCQSLRFVLDFCYALSGAGLILCWSGLCFVFVFRYCVLKPSFASIVLSFVFLSHFTKLLLRDLFHLSCSAYLLLHEMLERCNLMDEGCGFAPRLCSLGSGGLHHSLRLLSFERLRLLLDSSPSGCPRHSLVVLPKLSQCFAAADHLRLVAVLDRAAREQKKL